MSRIRVGIVGCGKVAMQHVRAWTWFPKEVEVVALVDVVREHAERIRTELKLHDARVLTDYRELLDDESIEAIDLCTYSDLHDDIICGFMEHGKHIMTEKPVGYSLENCRKMRWYARKYAELKVGVAYSLRYYPINMKVKEIVASGAIGQVLHAEITHMHPHDLKGRRRNWIQAKARRGIERSTDLGGRYIASSEMCHTTHPFDLMRYILSDEPVDVFAFFHTSGTFVMMRFAGGALGKVTGGTSSTRGIPHVTPVLVQGTEGTIYTSWDHFNNPKDPELKAYLVSNGRRRVITVDQSTHTGHGDYMRSRNFIDALRKDAPLICDMTDAVATSEMLHAIWESASLEIRVPIHRRTQTG